MTLTTIALCLGTITNVSVWKGPKSYYTCFTTGTVAACNVKIQIVKYATEKDRVLALKTIPVQGTQLAGSNERQCFEVMK